jgi:hypothetical protein
LIKAERPVLCSTRDKQQVMKFKTKLVMRKPTIAFRLRPTDYAGFINLGNRVAVSLTANANFTTPAVAIAILQAAITAAENAYALWAPLGNRGSHTDLLDLKQKIVTLSQLLRAEANYVLTTAQVAAGSDFETMAAIIGTSGFELANAPAPQGVLQAVDGFRKMVDPSLNPNQVKLKWKKPLNTGVENVSIYRVMRATSTNFAAAVQIATPGITSFVDTNDTGTVQTYTYWVIAVNYAGDGAVSDAVTVSVLPM